MPREFLDVLMDPYGTPRAFYGVILNPIPRGATYNCLWMPKSFPMDIKESVDHLMYPHGFLMAVDDMALNRSP